MRRLAVRRERWPLAATFTISRGSREATEVVVAEIEDGGLRGRGECVPYARYGESVEGVMAAIEALAGAVAEGIERDELAARLPAGAARNALDCALWDLEAKAAGRPAWELAGLAEPLPLLTAYTLSLDTPERMREAARRHAARPLLKLKLGGDADLERVAAVREGAPEARIIVDANEGWDLATLEALAPRLAAFGVELIEQPLAAGADAALAGLDPPVALCADESCHDRASLEAVLGRYQVINIKLDKTGGLSEALRLREAALAAGLEVMVGCMIGTSLAMAPAVLVGQGARVVDLDAPLLLAADREPGLRYERGRVHPPAPELWG